MLGEELDKQVQSYLLDLHYNGAVVNSPITIAVAQGIATNYNSNLLLGHVGKIFVGFVKRQSTTKAKVSIVCKNSLCMMPEF